MGTSASAAAVIGSGTNVNAQVSVKEEIRGKIPEPSPSQLDRDVGAIKPPIVIKRAAQRPGSDLMVQVLKDLKIEFIAANPASSFEGLQESIINYGPVPNTMPELITALHEESAVDMAHGYAKAEGAPMAVMLHGTVGLQHASMAIYQAYHDKTPIIIIVGRDDKFFRQEQTANDIAGLTRAFTKWDVQPTSLSGTLDAIQRAHKEAITPPMGPVVIVIDTEFQKEEAGELKLPIYTPPIFNTINKKQAKKIAQDLLLAKNPRIQIGKLRTPEGILNSIKLVELSGCSVRTAATNVSMSFPERHPQTGKGNDTNYDYILGLESDGVDVSIQGPTLLSNAENRDLTEIGFGFIRDPVIPPRLDLTGKNDITADAEASIPIIIEQFKRLQTQEALDNISVRVSRHESANSENYEKELKKTLEKKRKGWNSSPVSLARLYSELWPLIRDLDWCLSSPTVFSSRHHVGLWDHNKPYSYLGMHGAGGIGYCIGASAGAGLAAKDRNRIVVNIQCDGDLNYTPGSLWTAAHHKLPLLTIMHNNRGYHQEVMYLHYMAGVRGRGSDRMHIGTTLREPFIDYAKLAEAYGVKSEGPIENPEELAAAYKRGIKTVLSGKPYLIDVITEPR
ncbi:thiamine pyrophosphate-binding protein [Woeseiaceae bacterium]|nr:thiamine pyrophosphate-binding protein [Woeseiaceae bacterium]